MFKTNLIRWFVLYIGVISLFTTVVTYSKYITTLPVNDEARTAKFDLNITNDKICSSLSNLCGLEQYKPYDEIEYYFTVDTTNLEVLSDLVLKISVNKEFRIISFTYLGETDYSISIPEYGIVPDSLSDISLPDNFKFTYTNNSSVEDNNNVITLVGTSGSYKSKIQSYKVKLKFMKDPYDSTYSSAHEYEKIVKIGYSINQKI
jgi:hypothetical protein